MTEKSDSEAPCFQTNQDRNKESHSSDLQYDCNFIRNIQLDNNDHYYQSTTLPMKVAEDSSTEYFKTSQLKKRHESTMVLQDIPGSMEQHNPRGSLTLSKDGLSGEFSSLSGNPIASIHIQPTSENNTVLDSQDSNPLGQTMATVHTPHEVPMFHHLPSIAPQSATQWVNQYPLYDQYPKMVQSYTSYSGSSQNTQNKRHPIPFHQSSLVSSQQLGYLSEPQVLDPFGYSRSQPMSNPSGRPMSSSSTILFHSPVSCSDHNVFSNYSSVPIYRGGRPTDSSSWSPGLITPIERLPSSSILSSSSSNIQSNAEISIQRQTQQQSLKDRVGHSLSKHDLIAMDPDPKFCNNCGTTQTPSWRRCRQGRILLCNACGLYEKLHAKSRPFFKARDGTIKIHRSLPGHPPCEICGATRTSIWSKGSNDEPICFSCNLISKQSLSKTRSKHESTNIPMISCDTRRKSRGINKKKSATSKVSYSPPFEESSSALTHVEHSSTLCRSKPEIYQDAEVYPSIEWHRHQVHNEQPRAQSSHYRPHPGMMENHTGNKGNNEASSNYNWDSQYLYCHGQDYFQQPNERHEVKSTSAYNAGLYQETCSSSLMFTEANASSVSPVDIPSPLTLATMPGFATSSPFEYRETGLKLEEDHESRVSNAVISSSSTEQSNNDFQQHLNAESSSFDNDAHGREVKHESDRNDMVSTPSSVESELTPVEDFDSD
ncbi:Trans-acting T-cell-specific transcription factor GATA-3 [Entomortierella beljakovae]|nr:Trans-acting T-cell-specific transcription factor GATA-3 [Entomortierella beljakovae]